MKERILKNLMALNVKSERLVFEYVTFCFDNALSETSKFETCKHHILPRTPFYNFINSDWNKCILSNDNHYKAHALLSSAIDCPSFHFAWYAMNNKNYVSDKDKPINIIGPDLYAKLIAQRNKAISENAKGKVIAFDKITNKTLKVTCNEFNENPNLVGVTIGRGGANFKNTVAILDVDGKHKRIKTSFYKAKMHVHPNKNKGVFKDSFGTIHFVDVKHPNVLNGEFVGFMRDTVSKHNGVSHNRFEGYYITPWGEFSTPKNASANFPNRERIHMTESMVKTYCKYKKVITKNVVTRSDYFKKDYSLVGRTYKSVGFWFRAIKEKRE